MTNIIMDKKKLLEEVICTQLSGIDEVSRSLAYKVLEVTLVGNRVLGELEKMREENQIPYLDSWVDSLGLDIGLNGSTIYDALKKMTREKRVLYLGLLVFLPKPSADISDKVTVPKSKDPYLATMPKECGKFSDFSHGDFVGYSLANMPKARTRFRHGDYWV